MAKDRETFIRDLVTGHRPVRPLASPLPRTIGWFLLTLVANIVIMTLVQRFRPGFAGQLVSAPRLLIEVAGGLFSVAALAYLVLAGTIPGERVPRGVRVGIAVLVFVFVGSIAIALVDPSPEPSLLGARAACDLEVLCYGGASMIFLLLVARKGYLRFSPGRSLAFGVIAGLIPATLMQIACLYDPWHALSYHYGPILLLTLIGAFLSKLLASRR